MGNKIPVERATLLARIDRGLLKDGRRVYRARSAMRKAVGDWVVVDAHGIVRKNVDLAGMAREMGCLRPRERM